MLAPSLEHDSGLNSSKLSAVFMTIFRHKISVGNDPVDNLKKYESKNPVARRLVAGFWRAFDDLVRYTHATDAHEIGCGEGVMAMRVSRGHGIRIRACDISSNRIDTARLHASGIGLHIPFAVRNLYDLQPTSDAANLIICCEVIEHLANPDAALDVLASLAMPWLLVSVPREPLWRMFNMARGRYLNDFGNTPGHFNHFSTREFIKFLRRRVAIVEVRKPLPWTMVLCKSYQTETSPPPIPSEPAPQQSFVTSEHSAS